MTGTHFRSSLKYVYCHRWQWDFSLFFKHTVPCELATPYLTSVIFFFFASKSDSYSNKKKDKISIPWLPSLTPPSASRVDPCLGLPSVIFDFTLALAR